MGMGTAGHIGLAKETSWGTAVAVSSGGYVEALSESMNVGIDRFDIKNIAGIYSEPDDMSGLRKVDGNIVFPVFPVIAGHFLRGIFGNPTSVTVIASGFLHRNIFKTPTADFAAGQPTAPYTFEIFRDVTSSHQYAGGAMKSIEFNVQPNQDLRATVGIVAKAPSIIAKTTPTYVNSSVEPFAFDSCSISIGGSGTALVETLSITIDNQITGFPALNATTSIAKVRRTGPQLVNISATFDFSDLTEYNNFINQTEQSLSVNFVKANSFQMLIQIPRMVYTAFPIGVSGRDRITVSVEGKGRYHVGSATAIDIQLTNTQSGY